MFTKRSVGLDISDHTIEVAELVKRGNNIKLANLSRSDLGRGVVVNGRLRNKERLFEILENVLKNARPKPIKNKDIVFGLSESCVFTHIFKIKNYQDKDLKKEISEELKNTIPIDHESLIYDYRLFQPYNYSVFKTSKEDNEEKKNEEDIFVRLVAVEKNIIYEWNNFFKENGFNVEIFDIESLATFRGLFDDFSKDPICIVDIGANKTKISIFTKFGLEYSFVNNVSGDVFTDIISEHLSVNTEEAENIKQKYGFNYDEDNKELEKKIKDKFKEAVKELKLNINYFENKNNQAVDKVVFIGGASKMKGLLEYLEELDLKHKFQLGSHQYENVNLEYIEAIGLNFRKLEKRWKKTDPCFIINSKSNMGIIGRIRAIFGE